MGWDIEEKRREEKRSEAAGKESPGTPAESN
jgi:hypothetical protein